ncbi:putative non-specific serine/threonine protein kinase [Helianthus annuus]|nr:putative non-specific serine/threonine protein kinase [Helianthus annuus]
MGNQWGLGLHFIFVTIFLVATTNTCLGARNITVACFEHERLALLKFKHSVTDDYNLLSSWVGNNCCCWKGVVCDVVTGNVGSLHLRGGDIISDSNFKGLVSNEVSTSLGELRHLKHLDLSMNNFQGSWIPKFIGSLKQLTYLSLSNANFSGIIPLHIGKLSNLKSLDLSSYWSHELMANELMAHDMAWVSGLSSLEHLNLSCVHLGGAKNFGMVFYIVPSLKELRLSDCGLTNADVGPLCNSSAALSNIRHLDLSGNYFEGQLPYFLRNMTSLQFLDLSFVDLSHAWNFANLLSMIPSLFELYLVSCNLEERHFSHTHLNFTIVSNIQLLDLSINSFPRSFPSIIANMTSLRILDLSYSSLNSSVPVMPNLRELELSSNDFEKFEDVGIWRQCHLTQLCVSSNTILMELIDAPINISKCSQYAMEWLDLTSSLKGTIPKSLQRMANLKGLHLSSGDKYHDSIGYDGFYKNYLNGSIPESLGKLRLLQILDLSGNMLTGDMPTFPGKLTKLDLSHNFLNGSIPESLGKLRLLQVLDLSDNMLTGAIPTFLGKLKKLYLSSNQLNGSIPESCGRLASLTHLSLENNLLRGPIPASIGKLVSLQSFSASSNFLSGAIPVSIGQLTSLRLLDVSNNSLEGLVFENHFANLSMLKYLNTASNTKLTFNISRDWLPPFQLIEIDLSSCKIENGFPQWLQNQRKLNSLVMSNATLSGPLPTWLRKMPIIRTIDLSHNNLNGPLTNLPSGGSNIVVNYFYDQQLFLQNNLFNESIPSSLCKRTNLSDLDLSRNRLTGKLPNCFKKLQGLGVLILSSNRLNGAIPSFIGNISTLYLLNLNENNFSGVLPPEFWNLRGLMVLDLGDNALRGKIPDWIGEKLKSLSVLRLHKNNFTGRIPQSLCTISQLQILDLAYNNITGTIPSCLGELYVMANKSLALNGSVFSDPGEGVIQVMKGVAMEYTKTLRFVINMDLSSNKLTGEIPIKLTALHALVGLNLSNNHLSGGIPNRIGDMKALNSLDFSANELSGLIPPSITTLTFLSHLNLSNNNLCGQIPTGSQLQTLIDPSIYAGNKDLCGVPLPKNCSNHDESPAMSKSKYEATDHPKKGQDTCCSHGKSEQDEERKKSRIDALECNSGQGFQQVTPKQHTQNVSQKKKKNFCHFHTQLQRSSIFRRMNRWIALIF